MKKNKTFTIFCAVLLCILLGTSVQVFAESCCDIEKNNSDKSEMKMMAKEMLEKYDLLQNTYNSNLFAEVKEKTNPDFVNSMKVKQESSQNEINNEIEKAENAGEKVYTYNEIMQLKTDELSISEADLTFIQSSIRGTVNQFQNIYDALVEMGYSEHQMTQNIKSSLNTKYPASMIYVSHEDLGDGHVSGGGWPYCLDDNGWGPYNFVNSDCQWAWLQYGQCLRDHIGNFVGDPSLRYCQAYVRNCSPLINHPSGWHTH